MVEAVAEAVGVNHTVGVYLRFAQIAPPSGYTAVGELLVAVAQPGARRGVRYVEHTSFANPYFNLLGVAEAVEPEHMARVEMTVVVDSAAVAEHVGLRDCHEVHAFLFKGAEHPRGVGPLLFVPGQPAHVLLFAVPVEVEHYAVERIPLGFQCVDHRVGFLLGLVAVFRSDVAQTPERCEVLSSGYRGEFTGNTLEACGRAYEVVAYGVGGCGGIVHRISGHHLGFGVVVDHHGIALGRDDQGHGDVHLRDARVALGVAVVLSVVHH